jgi:hypothetical protein
MEEIKYICIDSKYFLKDIYVQYNIEQFIVTDRYVNLKIKKAGTDSNMLLYYHINTSSISSSYIDINCVSVPLDCEGMKQDQQNFTYVSMSFKSNIFHRIMLTIYSTAYSTTMKYW